MQGEQLAAPGWVPGAAREAMVRLLGHAEGFGLENTEEFTYRSFFMASAHVRLEQPIFHTEWRTFDLLVLHGDQATLVEFKYYLYRWTRDLDGRVGDTKGGAGVQNEQEFAACLAKLGSRVVPGITARHLVLVYQRETRGRARRSYETSFGELAPFPAVERVWRCSVGPLELRVFDIGVPDPAGGPSSAPLGVSMAELRAQERAPLLWFGEDAAAMWMDAEHDFDASPLRRDECVLCGLPQNHHR
ncbi:hypothetical protein FHN55_09155 [Streptomyces sp. NP160]|uniref:hypothetical protein n=1 Tax=Streptomyces sp. NP160 TaxID=2586637 RepID=UPI00111A7E4A|nr:hypothetical protein [Streptomyces sp. NP160]TNM67610.1 hypothetical protein FHN55_09155 [Streptomyces sp. NP160]